MSYYEIRIRSVHPDNYELARAAFEAVTNIVGDQHYGADVEFVNEGGDVIASFHVVAGNDERPEFDSPGEKEQAYQDGVWP